MSQTTVNGTQIWQNLYETFRNVDFKSYDFQTLRKSMVDYIKLYNPENFNDYIDSSEFVALIDLIAFMGQSMSFRFDLTARENFLATAQSRNSITNLAQLINYQTQRNLAATGFLKLTSVSVNDDVFDSLGNNLNGLTINWNDKSNTNWQDQWNSVLNATLTNSQTIGNPGNENVINGIPTSEYSIAMASGSTPPFPFSTIVNGTSMAFEAVNPSSIGQEFIYELDPNSGSVYNLLYENDNLGLASNNTGYFVYFKQGSLTSQSFTVADSLPNRVVDLNITGINNTDVWLYQINSDGSLTEWTLVPAIYGANAIYNNLPSTIKNVFSITNRAQDAISLVFGDGVFGTIPVGNFICYVRVSNGLTYRINPSEMTNIQLAIPYTSKLGRTQTLTLRASLLYTVGNSSPKESLTDVKTKAPQAYYTQNRMVNGQDYNSFPFTQYSNIVKIKAVNRTSSGVSRYLDVIDPTGKYSSINVFCDDGFIYEDDSISQNTYTFNSIVNLGSVIESNVIPAIANSSLLAFFFENYPAISPSTNNAPNTSWNLVLTDNSTSSGFITDISSGQLLSTQDLRFAPNSQTNSLFTQGCILQFTAPAGFAFDINNDLVANPSGILNTNQKTVLYAGIETITLNGIGNSISANGVNVDGSGAILISQKVPTGAVLTQILPLFTPIITTDIIQNLVSYLNSGYAVALEYNPNNIGLTLSPWILDNTLPLNFNPATYGTAFTTPAASPNTPTTSWLLAFVPNNNTSLTVYQRSINYYFGSQQETTFYFDSANKVYSPQNESILNDQIKILKTNSLPGQATNLGFSNDIIAYINGTVNEINGSLDTFRVAITYSESNQDNVPDNPFFFENVVGTIGNNLIFFVTDNSQSTTTLIGSGPDQVKIVNSPLVIDNNLYSYANGDIIFSTSNNAFYQITRIGNIASKSTLNNPGDTLTYSFFTGRQDLKFQYQHNAPDNRRIDPSPSNIIDVYILDQEYANDYQAWITDVTGQVVEPTPPTTDTLSNEFSGLFNYRMISDLMIFNPATFKPLFGSKADPQLQANFVVISNPNLVIGDGEVKSQVITAINNYFAVGNFDFGQTFYATELISFIHNQLNDIISSVHLVPSASNLVYGQLQEITCMPNEIFISAATVNNVQVVTSLNNLNLKIGS